MHPVTRPFVFARAFAPGRIKPCANIRKIGKKCSFTVTATDPYGFVAASKSENIFRLSTISFIDVDFYKNVDASFRM